MVCDWLIDWLIDWSINWLQAWLLGWLIDWLYASSRAMVDTPCSSLYSGNRLIDWPGWIFCMACWRHFGSVNWLIDCMGYYSARFSAILIFHLCVAAFISAEFSLFGALTIQARCSEMTSLSPVCIISDSKRYVSAFCLWFWNWSSALLAVNSALFPAILRESRSEFPTKTRDLSHRDRHYWRKHGSSKGINQSIAAQYCMVG